MNWSLTSTAIYIICRQAALLHSLRFLGRPDMALLNLSAISEGKPIDVYNYGKMKRDFTYIDDVIEGDAGDV